MDVGHLRIIHTVVLTPREAFDRLLAGLRA